MLFSRRTPGLHWKSLGLILAACLLTACGGTNTAAGNTQPVSGKAKPGYIAGKAVDTQGKGIVKDFVWKLAGSMGIKALDPNDPSLHYGGSLSVFGESPGSVSDRLKLADGFTLEVTLTPDGPLIDGSAGQPVTFKHQYAKGTLNFNPENQRTFIDIPLGKYTATVKAINADGSTRNLRAAASWTGHTAKQSDLAAAAAVEFAPITVGFPGLARDVQTTSLEIMP